MKILISILVGLSITLVQGQESKTIYCNGKENVALIMDQPILQAITGSENFVFSYNQTTSDSLGLLQGREGADSNLLIRTNDGGLYSFKISYRDSLPTFIYFIKAESRINQVVKVGKPGKPERQRSNVVPEEMLVDYSKLSNYYLNRPARQVAIKKKNKLTMQIQGMHYYKDNVYLVVNIRNRSGIDFSIGDLVLSRVHGMEKRKSSYQEIVIDAFNAEEIPGMIASGLQRRFVLVYPKFTLGDHERLELLLSEKDGSRYLNVKWE